MSQVLLSGVFRSGTTLLSKMLSVHPGCLVVSDPCIYFFKAYRDFHLEAAGVSPIRADAPTSDWFDPLHHEALQRILEADLSEPMPEALKTRVRTDIEHWKGWQHPRLVGQLSQVDGHRFSDFFKALIELAGTLYGCGTEQILGTKISWCEEFLPALSRAFPEMRFVFIQRDLRAIIASQDHQQGRGAGKRPLLFYVRHWRKAWAFHHIFEAANPDRVQRVRYEDLVRQPKDLARQLCQHLDLPPCEEMLQTERFRDEGADTDWQPNSSFSGTSSSGFFTDSIDRWKSLLSPVQIAAAEALAGPELLAAGYDLGTRHDLSCYLKEGSEPDLSELPSWLQDQPEVQYLRHPGGLQAELAREQQRRSILESAQAPDSEIISRFLIHPQVREALREAWLTPG
jgi:hypothetical protein